MINLLLHKDIENNLTVNFRPLDSVMLNRPIIPRGFFFSPWSSSSLYQDCTLLTFQFCLSVHSLPSIFSSRIYRAFGHSVFPSIPLQIPSPPFILLYASGGWHQWTAQMRLYWHLASSLFQPMGGTSPRSELGGREKLEYLFHQLPHSWAEIW